MANGRNVAVDFDHCLVDGDKPRAGAREAMCLLREKGFGIVIHSCNNKSWIEKVLRNADIPFDYISGNSDGKPACSLYIDDRGYRYQGDWASEIETIMSLLESKSE